jgi:protein-disulfide isomerase
MKGREMKRIGSVMLLFFMFIVTSCTDKERIDNIEKTQKEILARLNSIEENQKKILRFFQPRRPVDYNRVYNIPIGNSPIKGSKNAPVTIVEFSDYECPYCATLQPTLEEVLKAYPKEVKLVFKNFPLSFHKQARNAAKAALAAGEQGKFWEMHDIIFKNYNRLSEERFKEFALQIGLDVKKFIEDYKSNKYDQQIQQDINIGRSIGVNGTPTVFINGKRLMRRSFNDFKEAIEKALKDRNSKPLS